MTKDLEILPPDESMSPLDFLKSVYRNDKLPLHARLKAAADAAPFCHPKLAVIASVGKEDLVEALERARRASDKVLELRAAQVIEAKPVDTVQVDEVPDHSKPFAQDK
jgi:hypothetical protein